MGQLQALQIAGGIAAVVILGAFLRQVRVRARRRLRNAMDAFARLQLDREASNRLSRLPRSLAAARKVRAGSDRM
jgi:hypothetical protein